jgi:hypothetical protein
MRRACLVPLAVFIGASAGSAAYAQDAPARPSITIARAAVPPRIEDYLSGERRAGTRVDGFLQRNPGDLTPASQRTEAYLSYDAQNVYAVFVCRLGDPSRLRAHMARRESIFSDDHVVLFLDTFNDRQRSYMFFSTPLGIQADGIQSDGQQDDFSFDTVWQSRGVMTSFGYVVWMAIPFKSLRFHPSDGPQSWGIALSRSIPTDNEQVFWPGITNRISGFASQFAEARGFDGVSAGRNIQAIPYATFTGARFLDAPAEAFDSRTEGRAGVDAKVVVRDAMTLDFTANPDFSQVESDEPQVTVNQRFEVFFPEKRPFFLENAGFFQTPVTLFFSRRLRDPQLGARLTGKVGDWAVGALAMDDRAPGHAVPPGSPLFGDRALNAVVRARREWGQSSVGALVTSRDFGNSSSRVAALDTRQRLNDRWFFDGQAVVSDTDLAAAATRDASYYAGLSRAGRGLTYQLTYQDVGRNFVAPLGFVPRVDVRQATSFASYRWRPKQGRVQAFGPNSFVQGTWDHDGQLQDWLVRFPFEVDFARQTGVFVRHAQAYERVGGIEFREWENLLNAFSSAFGWMDLSLNLANGTRPNFYPATGLPTLGSFVDASLSLTLRPASQLLIDETYLYSHLGERAGDRRTIFDNHIVRTKVNYQFTRALSLRAIVDYNAILSNPDLVALPRTKHLTGDILMTYLLSPGTALYVGYTNGFDNLALDPVTGLRPTRNPSTSTGRQFFVKTSYLFRF